MSNSPRDTGQQEPRDDSRADTGGDGGRSGLDEFIARFYDRYPRLARVLSTFRQTPLSGNTLRMLLKGEEEITRDQRQVQAMPAPMMWERDAPIVISHYTSYASDRLPRYWNTVLPDIQDRYGENARYEHHDVPIPERSLTEYKLATVGRSIQDEAGMQAFWTWFNTIMVDGVRSMSEAYDILDELPIDVETETVEDAVEYDVYEEVLWNDIYSLLGKVDEDAAETLEQQIDEGEPIFVVFVNGVRVEPSYDSIVGVIEDIRAVQNGNVSAEEVVAAQQQPEQE